MTMAADVMRENEIGELKAEIRHWRTVAAAALARLSTDAARDVVMTSEAIPLPHAVYLPRDAVGAINDDLDGAELGRHLLLASEAHDFAPVRVVRGDDYFGAEHRHPCLVSARAEVTHICPTVVDGRPTLAGVAAGPNMTPIFPEHPVHAPAVASLRVLRLRDPDAYGKLLAIVAELSAERDRIVEREKEQER